MYCDFVIVPYAAVCYALFARSVSNERMIGKSWLSIIAHVFFSPPNMRADRI
jgi:hypothetical protein